MWPHTTTDFAVRKEMMGNAQLFGHPNMADAADAEEKILRRVNNEVNRSNGKYSVA